MIVNPETQFLRQFYTKGTGSFADVSLGIYNGSFYSYGQNPTKLSQTNIETGVLTEFNIGDTGGFAGGFLVGASGFVNSTVPSSSTVYRIIELETGYSNLISGLFDTGTSVVFDYSEYVLIRFFSAAYVQITDLHSLTSTLVTLPWMNVSNPANPERATYCINIHDFLGYNFLHQARHQGVYSGTRFVGFSFTYNFLGIATGTLNGRPFKLFTTVDNTLSSVPNDGVIDLTFNGGNTGLVDGDGLITFTNSNDPGVLTSLRASSLEITQIKQIPTESFICNSASTFALTQQYPDGSITQDIQTFIIGSARNGGVYYDSYFSHPYLSTLVAKTYMSGNYLVCQYGLLAGFGAYQVVIWRIPDTTMKPVIINNRNPLTDDVEARTIIIKDNETSSYVISDADLNAGNISSSVPAGNYIELSLIDPDQADLRYFEI